MLELKKNNRVVLLSKTSFGNLRNSFESHFDVFYLDDKSQRNFLGKKTTTIDRIKGLHNIDLIYVNTIASCDLLPLLKSNFSAPIYSHIHELAYSIKQFGVPEAIDHLFSYSSQIIACSTAVKENLETYPNATNVSLVHSFVNNDSVLERIQKNKKDLIRSRYGLKPENFKIVACGNADFRKGPDLFLMTAQETIAKHPNIQFIWIGMPLDSEWHRNLMFDIKVLGLQNNVTLIPQTPDAIEIIDSCDVFLLCSREDPFPLVMLEAALCAKPIIGFNKSGGASEFIESDAGILCNYAQTSEMSEAILLLKKDQTQCQKFGITGKEKVLSHYSFQNSFFKITEILDSAKY